ncbi:MAG: hypothetical protein U0R70_14705 [Solirubrobacteraceae bacterium]
MKVAALVVCVGILGALLWIGSELHYQSCRADNPAPRKLSADEKASRAMGLGGRDEPAPRVQCSRLPF